jgi:hypothetical protein
MVTGSVPAWHSEPSRSVSSQRARSHPSPFRAAYARQANSRQSAGSPGGLAVIAGSLFFWFGLARLSQPYACPSSVLVDELDPGRCLAREERPLRAH